MTESIRFIFPLVLFLPLMMSAISTIKFKQKKRKEFLHLTEFFLSITVMVSTTLLLWPMGPAFIVLSMIPWTWFLRTFGLICSDMTGITMFHRWHYLALFIGGLVSLVLLLFKFNLPWIVAPFSLTIGLIGLTFIFQAFQKTISYGPLHYLNFILGLGFLVSRITVSMWIMEENHFVIGSLIDISLILLFCGSLYPLYVELVQEQREKFLEGVLRDRNQQLFSHSGFSEFKILSSGISHEVNNALTVINTKIEQLLRGSERDSEKGLRIILNGANRIVRSMRGLRDFIHPQEISEDLELKAVVDDVLSLYGQRLINHGVKVKTEGLSDKIIRGHRIQMEQVFLILINNSVDALDRSQEKEISIRARSYQEYVQITFEDTAPSRAKEILPLLNDPFFSTEQLMDDDIRLALAKDIVEKHGGHLQCVKGKENTTLLIDLPLSEEKWDDQKIYVDRSADIGPLH